MKFRDKIIQRLDQLLMILKDPPSLKARIAGCYFEIYQTIIYLKKNKIYPLTIIDVGANKGIFSYTANYIFPNATIYAFEPLKSCFEELKKLNNKIQKLYCYNLALGNESGEVDIFHNDYDYSSSLLEMAQLHTEAFPQSAKTSIEKITIEKLDSVLLKDKILRPSLMKIDVQGYEKSVLEGAIETLPLIDFIICELSFAELYKGQPLFDDVYQYLLNSGFRFIGPISVNKHSETGSVLQIDGLFKRIS